jgi:ParB-like chromosome segregation protein Spo0J
MPELTLHPVTGLFLPLAPSTLAELREDIQKHGIRIPIVVWEGQVIDGRHRLEIARELEIDCPQIAFHGTEEEAIHHSVALNKLRRHLTTAQRAMIGARMVALFEAAAAKRQRLGTTTSSPGTLPPNGGKVAQAGNGRATGTAAALAGTSERSVQRAKQVLDHAEPEVIKLVQSGAMPLDSAAQAAKLPGARQRVIAEHFNNGQKNEGQRAVTAGAPRAKLTPREVLKKRRAVLGKAVRVVIEIANEFGEKGAPWYDGYMRAIEAVYKRLYRDQPHP